MRDERTPKDVCGEAMVGIRLFSVWEQNIDDLVANHHTDEKRNA